MDVGGHGDCYSPAERGESGRRGEGESSGAPGFDGSVRVQECVPDAGRSLKKKGEAMAVWSSACGTGSWQVEEVQRAKVRLSPFQGPSLVNHTGAQVNHR